MTALYLKFKGMLMEVDGLNYIDQDFNQFEISPPPVTFPAALIRIEFVECEDLTDGTQRVRILVTLRLGFNPYQDKTSNLFDVDTTTAALDYWNVVKGVYKKFQSYWDGDIEQMSRKSMRNQVRHDKLTVVVMPFETYADDVSALG